MKLSAFITTIAIGLILSLSACSKCYECTTENLVYYQGNVIDTTTTVDDFCTSEQSEVTEKESAGADCKEV